MTTKAKTKKTIKVFKTLDEINQFAADKFISIGNNLIKKTGRFTVALPGGSTPKSLYQLLGSDQYNSKIDWEKVYFFIGDDRDVSPISASSNYKMINESLFNELKIPATNIFRWHTEIINAPEVAQSYERSLIKFFELEEGEFPKFDLIFLGMGDDGHTASLFPFTDALKINDQLVSANYVEKINATRLTFTFPTINNATNIIFLISGKEKSEALKEVHEGIPNCDKFPAQCIKPINGKLLWLVDEAAADLLNS
jgi:6-phosphogluconolactonase